MYDFDNQGDGFPPYTDEDLCQTGSPINFQYNALTHEWTWICKGNDNVDVLCSAPEERCGDGVVNSELEECDDGNDIDGDECNNSCEFNAICGSQYDGQELYYFDNNGGDLDENTPGLCDVGEVTNFSYDPVNHSWTWLCTVNDGEVFIECNALELWCGDENVNGPAGVEECDDGNDDPTDGCDQCEISEMCGDGMLQDPETCEYDADSDTYSYDGSVPVELQDPQFCDTDICQVIPFCGDGYWNTAGILGQPNEECDPSVPGSVPAGLTCDPVDCVVVGFCGDGFEDFNGDFGPAELCDDGTHCADGTPCSDASECVGQTPDELCVQRSCDGCNIYCEPELCGNGVVECGEECDDGDNDNGDGCNEFCELEECGNGVVDPGEECDEGVNNTDIPCDAPYTPLEPGETCSYCTTICELEENTGPYCGDDTIDLGFEECDNGQFNDGVTIVVDQFGNESVCSPTCELVTGCPNGLLEAGEQCEFYNGQFIYDSSVPNEIANEVDACDLSSCLVVGECGDLYVDVDGSYGPAESCDDGRHCSDGSACSVHADCANVNGPDQLCTPRNNDGCNIYCQPEFCGDGILQVALGEECDDGNNIDGDGCDNDCKYEFAEGCGDGILDPDGADDIVGTDDDEECEFTGDNMDEFIGLPEPELHCSHLCNVIGLCGDGFLDTEGLYGWPEVCDDGNDISGDGCSYPACEPETPDLVIEKEYLGDPIQAGVTSQVQFSLTYQNVGNTYVSPVYITDTMPAGFTFVDASVDPTTVNGQVITWAFNYLAPGQVGTIIITLEAELPVGECPEIINYVDITIPPLDGTPDNNSDSAEVPCGEAVCEDLTLTVGGDDLPIPINWVCEGDGSEYDVQITYLPTNTVVFTSDEPTGTYYATQAGEYQVRCAVNGMGSDECIDTVVIE